MAQFSSSQISKHTSYRHNLCSLSRCSAETFPLALKKSSMTYHLLSSALVSHYINKPNDSLITVSNTARQQHCSEHECSIPAYVVIPATLNGHLSSPGIETSHNNIRSITTHSKQIDGTLSSSTSETLSCTLSKDLPVCQTCAHDDPLPKNKRLDDDSISTITEVPTTITEVNTISRTVFSKYWTMNKQNIRQSSICETQKGLSMKLSKQTPLSSCLRKSQPGRQRATSFDHVSTFKPYSKRKVTFSSNFSTSHYNNHCSNGWSKSFTYSSNV